MVTMVLCYDKNNNKSVHFVHSLSVKFWGSYGLRQKPKRVYFTSFHECFNTFIITQKARPKTHM